MVEDVGGRGGLLDAVDDDDLVGHREGLFLVMGDEDGSDMHLVVQAPQPVPQLLTHAGIDRAEGLVQQQHLGLWRQCARQRDTLALAAGELPGITLAQAGQSHQIE